jgi:hypothetical protein
MQLIGGNNGAGTVSWLRADGTVIGSQTYTTSNTAIIATITVPGDVRSFVIVRTGTSSLVGAGQLDEQLPFCLVQNATPLRPLAGWTIKSI